MTKAEAVKWLESLKQEIGKTENRSLWHYAEAIDMVIEAMSEPKTGEWVKVIDEETSNVTKWHYECDQCRTGQYENGQRYCHNCGAKMLGEDGEA